MKKLSICLVITALLAGCSGDPEPPKNAMVESDGDRLIVSETSNLGSLKLASVGKDEGSVLNLPGRLVWDESRTVRIFPQLGGRVRSIAVDIGDRIKSGQVLAELLSPDFSTARADARSAEATLNVAEKSLARSRILRDAGVVAEKDHQQSEAELTRARAEAERARQRMTGLGGEGDGNYALRSPLAGVLVERNLNPGMEFRPEAGGPPLFVVTDPTHLWLQVDATEADLATLHAGDKVRIDVKQFQGQQFAGVIERIADFVDPATRTVKVRCRVDNPDRRLKGEMFASAIIELPPSNALHVPVDAVMLQGDKQYVLVEEMPGRYRRQQVVAGNLRDGKLDVTSGLKVGERVVVDGNLHLIRYYKPAKVAVESRQ